MKKSATPEPAEAPRTAARRGRFPPRVRIALTALASLAAIVALAGIVAIVVIADGARMEAPSRLHRRIESALSRAVSRKLSISGPLEISWSPRPTLSADDVSLVNLPWASEPVMVRARRVAIVFDLASIWSGPLRVRELEIEGARVLLERDGEGRGNWIFPRAPGPASQPPRVDLERAAIRGLEISYRSGPDALPLELGVEELAARLDPATRNVGLDGNGRFRERPWEIAGRIGTLEEILAGRDVDSALTCRLGEAKIGIEGEVGELFALGGLDLEIDVEGPDIAAALDFLGGSSPLTGAFRVRGKLTTGENGFGIDAQGEVEAMTLAARGVVKELETLEPLDFHFEAAGPDAARAGSWLGVRGLPSRPFEIAGRARRADGGYSLEGVTGRVGRTSLTLAGELGLAPRFAGTNLSLHATGEDLSELSGLSRLRLPRGPFELEGRLLRRDDGLSVDAAELSHDGATIRASGLLGEPPRLSALALAVEASGPDLARFSGVLDVALPSLPFELKGGIARDGAALRINAVKGRLDTFDVAADGRLTPRRGLAGTDLRLQAAGPDFARFAALVRLEGAPSEPFDVRGRLRVDGEGYEISGTEAAVGRLAGRGTVRLSAPSARRATVISGTLEGTALSDLAAWGIREPMPADPFSIAGRIRIDDGVYSAEDVVVNAGSDHARVDGVIGALPDVALFDANVELSGPSLAAVSRFLPEASRATLRSLPAEAYSASGRVRLPALRIELDSTNVEAMGTRALLRGTISTEPGLGGTELWIDAAGPDTTLLAALAGTALPPGPFEARGNLVRDDSGLHSDGIAFALGEARAQIAGTLGAWPELRGSDLRIDASGPSLAAILLPFAGRQVLPAKPFALSVEIAGTADRFSSKRFDAALGETDLSGELSMRLDGRLTVDADLRARHIDVSRVFAGFGEQAPALTAVASGPAPSPGTPPRQELLIPSEVLDFTLLDKLDLSLQLEADELAFPNLAFRDVTLAAELKDGALRIDRFDGHGILGGRASGSFAIEPLAEGYGVRAAGRIDDGRLVPPLQSKSPLEPPTVDLELDLRGAGRSIREIATSGTGHALIVVSGGQVSTTFADRMDDGVLRSLMDALTPFRKSSDHADIECGVALVEVGEGEAVVEPIALRTDRMTLTGRGGIDFETEEIDLTWTLKERKGIGVSAGEIANSYIALGGTLASPRLDLKPLQALTSTAAAVATAGATTLARGMWDRITADRKVCALAMKEAKRRIERRETGNRR